MKQENLTFQATNSSGDVSSILFLPEHASHLLVLGHGAGAPMQSKGMGLIAYKLADAGIATLRYNFPYMEKGVKRPDPPAIAQKTVRSAVEKANSLNLGLPILAGGKSFGGRMTSQAQSAEALEAVKGLVFYGFPLHAPGRDGTERADHLKPIDIPVLFLQGTRDSLAKLPLIQEVGNGLPKATMHIVDGADHSFHLPKKMETSDEEVQVKLANVVADWSNSL